MKKFKKIFLIVADSVGIGALDDAFLFNDANTNTFGHIAEKVEGFKTPVLESLGIGNICPNQKILPTANPIGIACRMNEISKGKDTLTGHFELMGLEVFTPFPSFTDTGFPKELIDTISNYAKRPVIGNISASGTEIIKELGEEQLKTGALIVYTSADSVLQIAAHEEVIPLKELYDICAYTRKITIERPEWMVGRIIARPYVGTDASNFKRTTNRHDYALKPFDKTVLDVLQSSGYDTIGIGKIYDIFAGSGVNQTEKTVSNIDGMNKTIARLHTDFTGLCFVNLVDFDMLYGHRRDVNGYAYSLMEFDQMLKEFMDQMDDDTLLMVTADHGNDPTHTGTDHTREAVPLLIYYRGIKGYIMKERSTFACVGATICDNFGVKLPKIGTSFLKEI